MERKFEQLGSYIQKHTVALLVGILAITVFFGFGLPKVQMDMGNDVFVNTKSQVYKDTETYQKNFGGDSAYILLSGQRDKLVSHETMQKINALDHRLNKVDNVRGTTNIVNVLNSTLKSGNATQAATSMSSGQSSQVKLMSSLSAKQKQQLQTTLGQLLTAQQQQQVQKYTLTILTPTQKQALAANPAAASQMASQLNVKQQQQIQAYTMSLLTVSQRQQLSGQIMAQIPRVEKMSTPLLQSLIFSDNGKVPATMQQLLPKDGRHVLFVVNTSDKTDMGTYVKMTRDINKAIRETNFQNGVKVRLAGSPAITSQVQTQVTRAMMTMLGLAVVVMIVVLSLIFRVRRRLFPLLFVAVSLIWTFGFMGWTGISLTLATMATLPIIIGLGTDFGVQFQNRYEETFRQQHDRQAALNTGIGKMGPAVGISLIVMTFSFLTMFLSKAPMMQQFGLTLAIGVISAYITELTLMFSLLPFFDRHAKPLSANEPNKLTQPSRLAKLLARYAAFVTKHSVIVLILGILLGGAGFAVEHNINTETDMTKMIPQQMSALKDTKYLQKQIGSTTYITYLVKSDDVRDKRVMIYTDKFGRQEQRKYSDVTGVTSLPTSLNLSGNKLTATKQATLTNGVSRIPSSKKQVLMSKNQHYATLQFKINKNLSSADQLKLMNKITKNIDAPHGIQVAPAGAEVMMLTGIHNMTANHWLIIIAGIAIIFLVLFLIYRDPRFAMYPILPILLVLGLSPLTLWLMGTSYNPLTISLSSLVLGIGTEFTILILERYREEQKRGKSTVDATVSAVSSVGQAIFVSGMTVIGGFSAIIFASFPVLKSFGLITVIDTGFSLISALTILPAIIVFMHRGDKRKRV
ncbi:MAG TPA: hydrogenase expression protein HypA [Lactobacillus sp.]|nr:hydrogenase expression protein HypA [Lactobacillus sp.]